MSLTTPEHIDAILTFDTVCLCDHRVVLAPAALYTAWFNYKFV